jgi:DNA polymerase III subunit delta'
MPTNLLSKSQPTFGGKFMADENEDPREVPWHPRHAARVIGHGEAAQRFYQAFDAGQPHHAWLLTGPKGIGKATLAYRLTGHVLGVQNQNQSARWIAARSHPDLFVLERKLGDTKPRKLKSEISVDDARGLSEFFSHTSSGGWRVGLVDAADDLNSESANALLKLVEEPPPNCLLLLVCHLPGRLLRTMKSRCTRFPLSSLSETDTVNIMNELQLGPPPKHEDLKLAARLSSGSPGRALSLLTAEGAKAFGLFLSNTKADASGVLTVANRFGGRGVTADDFTVFGDLLLDWIAGQASHQGHAGLAAAHGKIAESIRMTTVFNLDKRQAVIAAVRLVQEALKAA